MEVTRVERDAANQRLTVFWRLHLPKKDAADGIAHVVEVILTDRVAGAVQFREDTPEKK